MIHLKSQKMVKKTEKSLLVDALICVPENPIVPNVSDLLTSH